VAPAPAAPSTLVAHADAAMHRAERAGRGRLETFDADDYEATTRATVAVLLELGCGLAMTTSAPAAPRCGASSTREPVDGRLRAAGRDGARTPRR